MHTWQNTGGGGGGGGGQLQLFDFNFALKSFIVTDSVVQNTHLDRGSGILFCRHFGIQLKAIAHVIYACAIASISDCSFIAMSSKRTNRVLILCECARGCYYSYSTVHRHRSLYGLYSWGKLSEPCICCS